MKRDSLVSFVIFFIIASFSLSACSQFDVSQISDEDIDRITNKVIVCNPPYIRHGADCCLDTTGTGICDRDEEIAIEKVDEEKEVKEDVVYEKPVVELNKTNETKELVDKVIPINQDQIKETVKFFTRYITNMNEFKELNGKSLAQTFIEVGVDNLYTEFIFYPEHKRSIENIEYYIIKINGSYMNIKDLYLYEISYFNWDEVDEDSQDSLLAKCLEETKTKYYADEECCDYQNDLLGNVFTEYKDIFYVNCADNMDLCTEAEIKGLPTWIINGNEKMGSFSKNQLANFMECIDVVSRRIELN